MSADERLDRIIHHQIGMLRVSEKVARQMVAILNKADKELLYKLTMIDPSMVSRSRYRKERLEKLIEAFKGINRGIYRELSKELAKELKETVEAEIEFQDRIIPGLSLPTPEIVYGAAIARPFQGALLKEMYSKIEANAQARLRDAVRMGFLEGESIDQVVKRIRGTRANRFQDGILDINRRAAYRVARTAVAHVASVTREAIYEANDDIIDREVWVSVLDGRTSAPCRARSGKLYTIKTHKPIGHKLPWGSGPGRFHFSCRSISSPVEIGEEPPKILDYEEWLKRQKTDIQKDILGPSRYKLWKKGKVSIDRFVERKETLTLDELREREAKAFEKAGL